MTALAYLPPLSLSLRAQADGPASAPTTTAARILVCTNTSCSRDGSASTYGILDAVSAHLPGVSVAKTGCLGECGCGPNVAISLSDSSPGRVTLGVRTASEIRALLDSLPSSMRPRYDEQDAVRAVLDAAVARDDAEAYVAADRPADALAAFEAAARCEALRAASLCNASWAAGEIDEWQRALTLANDAVDADPGRPAVWRRKAEAHAALVAAENGTQRQGEERQKAIDAWQMWGQLAGQEKKADRQIAALQPKGGWRLPFL